MEEETLGGWCRVGSIVTSDFYLVESEMKRRVVRIVKWHGSNEGSVWTDAGVSGRPLHGVDFKTWIKKAI